MMLICWLLAAAATYWNSRRIWKKDNHLWTNGDAFMLLAMSLSMWYVVLLLELSETDWFDREAKW